MPEPAYLIALEDAQTEHRNAVQAIVKAHSSMWWHQLSDLWVVEGHSAAYWRDLIAPVTAGSRVSVIVFRLPDSPNREWASWAVKGTERTRWLKDHYSSARDTAPEQPNPG
jgi:hypothetical protein